MPWEADSGTDILETQQRGIWERVMGNGMLWQGKWGTFSALLS